jgi:hypothetical protein
MTRVGSNGGAGEARGRPGPFRRLYHWVLDWAHRPGGPVALFGIATAERPSRSSFRFRPTSC